MTLAPLRPTPAPSERPWAGRRLGPPDARVGELWLAGPDSIVTAADGTSSTLDELADLHGAALVGERRHGAAGRRGFRCWPS